MAGCAGGGDEKPAAGADATGADVAAPSQVIVSMTVGSEPAGGLRPAACPGAAASTCTSRSSSRRSSPRTPTLSFESDLATSYECLRRRHDLDVQDPRRREVHRRRRPLTARDVAFTINGILELRGFAQCRPVHGRGKPWRDRRRHAWSSRMEQAVQRAALHAGRGGHRARARLRRRATARTPSAAAATCLSSGTSGQQVILKANPDYYGERRRRSSAWWPCSWRRTPRSPRRSPARLTWPTPRRRSPTQQPAGYDAAELRVGGLARHLAAHRAPPVRTKTDENGRGRAPLATT